MEIKPIRRCDIWFIVKKMEWIVSLLKTIALQWNERFLQGCRIFCRFSHLFMMVDVILITLCAVKFHIRLSEQMILRLEQSKELQLDGRRYLILCFSHFISSDSGLPDWLWVFLSNFVASVFLRLWTSLPSQSRLCMGTDRQQWEWSADHLKPPEATWLHVRETLFAYFRAGSEAPSRSAPRGSCSCWWRRRSAGWSGRVRWVFLQ